MARHRRARGSERNRIMASPRWLRRRGELPQWVAARRGLLALLDAGEELTYREARLLTTRAHGFRDHRGDRPRRGW